jgi:hypothetical protein
VPYRLVFAREAFIDTAELNKCSTLIVPEVRCLSDRAIEALKAYKGELVLAGEENGGNDENYCQRETLPLEDRATRRVEITSHDVSKAMYYKFQIFFKEDNWAELFPTEAKVEMHTAAHAVFKQDRDGRIPGVCISSVCPVSGGTITLPEHLRTGEYVFETISGTQKAIFKGDTVEVPPFEGMIMLCSES